MLKITTLRLGFTALESVMLATNGENKMNWFDHKRFWSLFYEWMFPEESFHQAEDHVDDIVKISGVKN